MIEGRNIYVAIVDDDESICRSFGRLLLIAGYQPVPYSSAESFLGDTKRPRFDCLLIDLQLQGISGLELSRRLAAVNDPTPVIFITAQDDPKVRELAEGSGCAGFFRKNDPGALILTLLEKVIHCGGRDDGKSEEGKNTATPDDETASQPSPKGSRPQWD